MPSSRAHVIEEQRCRAIEELRWRRGDASWRKKGGVKSRVHGQERERERVRAVVTTLNLGEMEMNGRVTVRERESMGEKRVTDVAA
jgi:hypothetical protein